MLVLTDRQRKNFYKKLAKQEDGCWEWTGYRTKGGYGSFNLNGDARLAHRVSYEFMVKLIPADLQIHHICRNRACQNPAHLRVVTLRENVLVESDSPQAINAAKTHCDTGGHEFTEENTYVYKTKTGIQRVCRTCRRERNQANRKQINEYSRQRYLVTRDRTLQQQRQYREAKREKKAALDLLAALG